MMQYTVYHNTGNDYVYPYLLDMYSDIIGEWNPPFIGSKKELRPRCQQRVKSGSSATWVEKY